MELILSITQIVVVVLLVITILMQQRGSSLGAAFGGGGEAYSTRRGAEKFIFYSTIVLSVLFLGLALAGFLLQ
ncbi:MAG: preprotein translocase subunit SecG [Patescibacteria group bacterium]